MEHLTAQDGGDGTEGKNELWGWQRGKKTIMGFIQRIAEVGGSGTNDSCGR